MLPTYVNVALVLIGTVLGRLAGKRLPERFHQTLLQAVGLVTIALGVIDLQKTHNPLVMLGSFVAGGIVGELLQIEEGITRLGEWAKERLGKGSDKDFGTAFVTTSLLFCVGPLTVLGSFEAGLSHDYGKLFAKSVMDGISSLVFSAALGWGVGLSAVTVLVVQGALTLGAGFLRPYLTDPMVMEMTATGGLILLGLGVNLLGIGRIRTASFLPALLFALLVAAKWG